MSPQPSSPVTTLLTAIGPEDHPGRMIQRILTTLREYLGLEVSFVSEFFGERRLFRFADGELASFGVEIDDGDPLEESYCQRVVKGTLEPLIADAQTDPRTRDLAVTRARNIGCYVGVPIVFSDGSVYGTLCSLSHQPNPALSQREIRFLHTAAALVAEQLERATLGEAERREARERILEAISDVGLDIVFQPIADLASGRVLGAEALARFSGSPRRPPNVWFDEAWSIGLGADLELAAARRALKGLEGLDPATYLSMNLSPETLLSPAAQDLLRETPRERVVVEITEHARVYDYEPLKRRLAELRGVGIRIALDDLGTGYSGMRHILEIRPEVIKIDVSVVRGIRKDPLRRALAGGIATFGAAIGASVVAEGIETGEELETLSILGIQAGQGYYLAKPGPLPLPAIVPNTDSSR